MGVSVVRVADGVANLQMPDGRSYDAGDVIELAVAQETVLGRTPVEVDAEDIDLFNEALASLVGDGTLVFRGSLSEVGQSVEGDLRVLWTLPVSLASIAAGEVIRITPKVAGAIVAWYAVVDTAVTTGSKAATLSLGIDAEDHRTDEVHTFTQTGSPSSGGTTWLVGGIDSIVVPYNANVAAVQALIDAKPALAGAVAGGTTGTWTIAFGGALADQDITASTVTASTLSGGSSPVVTPTTTTIGGQPIATGSTISLTSAAATPAKKVIAGSTITANDAFDEEQDLVITASSVTAFVEGAVSIHVLLQQG